MSETDPAGPNARTKVRRRPPNTPPRITTPHVAASPAPSARRAGALSGSHCGGKVAQWNRCAGSQIPRLE